ncbi:MAG: nitroreductase family protein [Deferribacteres bacterium]|nr:nitroreductase family protein [candidate division KSB1 bacterium]MCB9501520.1 nitroreductase family protein [Deferribacteres bacterium]
MDIQSRFELLPFVEVPAEEQLEKSRQFYELLKKRRSVRHFSNRPVADIVIQNIIATAATAPSGANKQPWRFVVITDSELKKNIRVAAEKVEKINYERRFPQQWLDDLKPLGTSFSKPFLEDAPVLIIVFKIDYEVNEDGGKSKNYYVNESVGIATGMLIAAIHNAGLVTVTHTPSPMKFLQDICKRSSNEKPFMLLPVGYPAEDVIVPKLSKKEMAEYLVVNPD